MRFASLITVAVLVFSGAALSAGPAAGDPVHNYAPVPVGPSAAPADVDGVLYARPFTLETPHTYTFRADQPAITSGWLLAVAVTPALAQQKDTWNPVLYVGRYPAEIAGTDATLGRMIVIVPGEVDLTRDPVFFGSVELPGEVSPERAAEEMQAALLAGFAPLTPEAFRTATREGGGTIVLTDAHALYAGLLADVIDRFAPADAGRADGYRVPLVETNR